MNILIAKVITAPKNPRAGVTWAREGAECIWDGMHLKFFLEAVYRVFKKALKKKVILFT